MPLKLLLPRLYKCCGSLCTVQDRWDEGEWGFDYRRPLGQLEAEWYCPSEMLKSIQLNKEDYLDLREDRGLLHKIHVQDYRLMTFRGVTNRRM